jgi:hypothetical protein
MALGDSFTSADLIALNNATNNQNAANYTTTGNLAGQLQGAVGQIGAVNAGNQQAAMSGDQLTAAMQQAYMQTMLQDSMNQNNTLGGAYGTQLGGMGSLATEQARQSGGLATEQTRQNGSTARMQMLANAIGNFGGGNNSAFAPVDRMTGFRATDPTGATVSSASLGGGNYGSGSSGGGATGSSPSSGGSTPPVGGTPSGSPNAHSVLAAYRASMQPPSSSSASSQYKYDPTAGNSTLGAGVALLNQLQAALKSPNLLPIMAGNKWANPNAQPVNSTTTMDLLPYRGATTPSSALATWLGGSTANPIAATR